MFTDSLLLSLRNFTIALVDGKSRLLGAYPHWQDLHRKKFTSLMAKRLCCIIVAKIGFYLQILQPELWFPGYEGLG